VNSNDKLFKSLDVEAIRRSELSFALVQVVSRLQQTSPWYTRYFKELADKCHKSTVLAKTVSNLLYSHLDYANIDATKGKWDRAYL
jgi:hypothetical protein